MLGLRLSITLAGLAHLSTMITGLIGTTLINRFIEGGALFMSLVLFCLLTSIYFTYNNLTYQHETY